MWLRLKIEVADDSLIDDVAARPSINYQTQRRILHTAPGMKQILPLVKRTSFFDAEDASGDQGIMHDVCIMVARPDHLIWQLYKLL